MTLATIEVFEKAADLGLKLAIAAPDRLTYHPIEKCSLDFVETLKTYKGRLLNLLRLPFVMVFSQTLGETILFCADEDTRSALVEAGAEFFSIYTRDELRVLVAQNRIAPLSIAELRKVHEIKRTFSGSFLIMSRRRYPHRAVTRVYDDAGNVIETGEQRGEFKEWYRACHRSD